MVSIHAPVMDAKAVTGVQVIAKRVSIHAPVMDAKIRLVTSLAFSCFNPRARDGREVRTLECRTLLLGFNPRARDGREAAALGLTVAVDVSIHAPVMDAK